MFEDSIPSAAYAEEACGSDDSLPDVDIKSWNYIPVKKRSSEIQFSLGKHPFCANFNYTYLNTPYWTVYPKVYYMMAPRNKRDDDDAYQYKAVEDEWVRFAVNVDVVGTCTVGILLKIPYAVFSSVIMSQTPTNEVLYIRIELQNIRRLRKRTNHASVEPYKYKTLRIKSYIHANVEQRPNGCIQVLDSEPNVVPRYKSIVKQLTMCQSHSLVDYNSESCDKCFCKEVSMFTTPEAYAKGAHCRKVFDVSTTVLSRTDDTFKVEYVVDIRKGMRSCISDPVKCSSTC